MQRLVARHVDRGFGIVGRHLVVPGGFAAFGSWSVDDVDGGLAADGEFTGACMYPVLSTC